MTSSQFRTFFFVICSVVGLYSIRLAWAATATWNGTYEAIPANTDAVSLGDDNIRDLKENIRDYAEAEMNWGTSGDNNGRMREGSARAFYAAADPTTLNGTDRTGSNTLGSTDDGRLLRRSDTGELKVWTGSAWAQAFTAISGTINLINTPLFAGTSSGGDTFDPREFTIRSITVDTTADTDCSTGDAVSTTAIGSQVFGDAGAACYSATLDLSTNRSTTNSRVLVLGQMTVLYAGTCDAVQIGIYRDSMSNLVGNLYTSSNFNISGENFTTTPLIFAYLTTVSAASHEFAFHVSDNGDDGCTFMSSPDTNSGNFLTVIDLGPDY